MNTRNEIRTKRNRRVLGVVALAILSSPMALADEQPVTSFQMGVMENEAFGHGILSGRYERAISKLEPRRHSVFQRFSRQNNLCVAYVKTAELDKAADACEAAVAAVRAQKEHIGKKSERGIDSRAYRSDLAVALSNRGVLLAVSGDAEKARADFQAAIDLGSRHARFAAANLRRLDAGSNSTK